MCIFLMTTTNFHGILSWKSQLGVIFNAIAMSGAVDFAVPQQIHRITT